MIPLDTITFGTDAEVFLQTLEGRPFPVCGLVGGTKQKPLPLDKYVGRPGYFVQEDNAALEFNVPPSHSIRQLRGSIGDAISVVRNLIPHSVQLNYRDSAIVFPKDYLKIPAMGVFGCEPDYNGWSLSVNPAPIPKNPGFRSAAAHVHVGWKNPEETDRINLVRLADIFVVLPSILHQDETEEKRRELYGKAGAFRWKKYGIEHRVLGNQWIMNPVRIQDTMFFYLQAIAALNANLQVDEGDFDKIQAAINTPHKKLAALLHVKYQKRLDGLLGNSWSWTDFYALFK